jgi:hypothetical protein
MESKARLVLELESEVEEVQEQELVEQVRATTVRVVRVPAD